MVPGDDAPSAGGAARALAESRVRCFWDPERSSGASWSEHYQIRFRADLESIFAGDPEMASWIASCAEDPSRCPMWDVAYFFAPDAAWQRALPEPSWWTKQFGFGLDADTGETSGTFWRSSSPGELVPSSWQAEFAAGMATIESARP